MASTPRRISLTFQRSRPGRVLVVKPDGRLYSCRHHTIYCSRDDGVIWTRVTAIGGWSWRRLAEMSRLACRLLRHEIRGLVEVPDGGLVATTRDAVYFCGTNEPKMTRSRIAEQGETPRAPMSLTVGPGKRVLWGEYWGNRERRRVRLYVSEDAGRSFEVCRVFEPGVIKHVHNIIFDEAENSYWVLAGDHGAEPGIGRLSSDLREFDWLVKGKQEYRAVCSFDLGDCLVYGTDSEMAPNAVIRLEKRSGRIERLAELPGSCIYACRFGGWYVVSTSVEPSRVNKTREAGLWVSRDTLEWHQVHVAPKDRWNASYFQFGSLVLPRGESNRETIFFSGQAVRGLDGRLFAAALGEAP